MAAPVLMGNLNCAEIEGTSSKACYRQRLVGSDFSDFDWTAQGTGPCTPPGCSYYAFTATAKKRAFDGPLAVTIRLPEGSAFPGAQVTEAPGGCSESKWSCVKTDAGVDCSALSCKVEVGERIRIRLDGKAAPELAAPPPEPVEKTACATLLWRESISEPDDIEQRTATYQREACHTINIVSQPQGTDLAIAKSLTGDCRAGQSCRFNVTVANRGITNYSGSIAIDDQLAGSGATFAGTSGEAGCTQAGNTLSCVMAAGTLAPGGRKSFAIEVDVAARSKARRIENCASIYVPQADDTSRLTRTEVTLLQEALNQQGFDTGPVDGLIGRELRAAVEAARAALQLPGDGDIDRALLAALLGAGAGLEQNPGNNRACASVEIAGETQPPPKTIVCEGGTVKNGVCSCPNRWSRTRISRDYYRCQPPPEKRLACEYGEVVGGSCVCPLGWERRRIASDHYRCIAPPPPPPPPAPSPIICENGKVSGNACICPYGWERNRISRYHYRCVAPQRPIICEGGKVKDNKCTCPRNWKRIRIEDRHFRCEAPPKTCPDGFVWSRSEKRCVPMKFPTPPPFQMICPKGTKWVPELNRCVEIVQ